MWQGKFFSPVCVLLCVFRSELVAKAFAHTSQICSLILSWTCFTWFFKSIFLENTFPHCVHSALVFCGNTFPPGSGSETREPPSIWGCTRLKPVTHRGFWNSQIDQVCFKPNNRGVLYCCDDIESSYCCKVEEVVQSSVSKLFSSLNI